MFRLSDLLTHDNIIIQCHNNPDADAIASGFAVYTYLQQHSKSVRLIYSGFDKITKSNLKLMIERLQIPIEHIQNVESEPCLLVCVDCQYGESNVAEIKAKAIAIIDHHIEVNNQRDLAYCDIRPHLGSCSTVVWNLLENEGFNFSQNCNIATALYYGLFTDTIDFTTLSHPTDKDMRDALTEHCDLSLIKQLSQCKYTVSELEIAGVALLRNLNDTKKRYAIFKAEQCDPNILGVISDFAVQADTIDVCIVYNITTDGKAKLSVRSHTREVMASEFVEFLTRNVGGGGGHREKAGGTIIKSDIEKLNMNIEAFIEKRAAKYFSSYDSVYAKNHNLDLSGMAQYQKKILPRGFVVSTDVFASGTPILIRTLEGDSQVKSAPDLYLMIGIEGEVYPIKAEKFDLSYARCDLKPHVNSVTYTPTVKNENTGEVKQLLPFMNSCLPLGAGSPVYAVQLTKRTKVFNDWNPNGYMLGEVGDYIAVRVDDGNDVYIVKGFIFDLTYERVVK